MRRLLLLVMIVIVAAFVLLRQRLFLRDPLGKVYVRGVEVDGARVFINSSNDVLVMRDGDAAMMVQGWDRTPGTPREMRCLRTLACLTESDQAGKIAAGGSGYEPKTGMGSREVTYVDASGAVVRVVIR